jgi:hypothetical protein
MLSEAKHLSFPLRADSAMNLLMMNLLMIDTIRAFHI